MSTNVQGSADNVVPDADVIEWRPADLFMPRDRADENGRFALVVLNQPLDSHLSLFRQLWNNAFVRVAADGGTNCLYEAAGKRGDTSLDDLRAIIGDLDSLTPDARAYYEKPDPLSGRTPTLVIQDPDQVSTDFGKAVNYTRRNCRSSPSEPLDIVAAGGLGGRVDQGLAQLHHLCTFQTDPKYAAGRMYLFSGESLSFLLKSGRHHIVVRDEKGESVFGKHCGIVPLCASCQITTKGLRWDVTDWETSFQTRISTNNHILPETKVIVIETTGDVLFTAELRDT